METFDLNSALRLKLPPELDEEFQNLKKVYIAKSKVVFSQIKQKEKELSQIQANGIDGKRAQSLNDLRNQILDQESMIDVLKKKIISVSDLSIVDLNQLIIKKLTEGPKIVRPLFREELENQVIEFESKISKLSSKRQSESLESEQKPTSRFSKKSPKFQKERKALFDFSIFEKELSCLISKIQTYDEIIQSQTTQINEMMTNHAKTLAEENESSEMTSRHCQEIEYSISQLTQALQEKRTQYKEIMSFSLHSEAQQTIQIESFQSQFQEIQSKCNVLSQENEELLLELERTREEIQSLDNTKLSIDSRLHTLKATSRLKDAKLNSLQINLSTLQSKQQMLEKEYQSLLFQDSSSTSSSSSSSFEILKQKLIQADSRLEELTNQLTQLKSKTR